MNKKELRRILKGRAAEMPAEYISSASADIAAWVERSEEYKAAGRIFVYVSMSREPRTDELIETALRDGKAVYVPRCIDGPEHLMEAVRIESMDDLESGSYGIREPRRHARVVYALSRDEGRSGETDAGAGSEVCADSSGCGRDCEEQCAPGMLDLAIIPCMSAWKDGRRLGHGAGYYDRFLARCRCPKMILCFEKMLDDRIEMDEHDIYMDVVVTEAGATKTDTV